MEGNDYLHFSSFNKSFMKDFNDWENLGAAITTLYSMKKRHFADRRVNALHHQTRGEGHQPSTAQSGVWCLKSGCRLFCTAADRRRDSGLLWGIIILKNPYFPHFSKIEETLL